VTHKLAKYLILAVSALGLSALPAAADSMCPTGGSLSAYLGTGFTCFIGDLDFSNFSYISSSSTGTGVPASAVTVDTVDSGNSGIGFIFNSSWTSAGAGSLSDADIGFTVSVIGGGPATLEDAALIQTGGVDKTNTGSIASVGENGCPGASLGSCTGTEWSLVTSQMSDSTAIADHTFFTQTGQLTVSKDITAKDGTDPNAFSSVSIVEDTFSQVPEPRSLALLLGFGLVAGLTLKRKLQSVQS